MISHIHLKSRSIAAIGTVIIHLLLFGALSIDFSGEQSSKLSDTDLDQMELQFEDISPQDMPSNSAGKDPLADQKDKASESVSESKGAVKPQQVEPEPERTTQEQEQQALITPDTLITPKQEITLQSPKDSTQKASKDSVMLAQISKLQKVPARSSATTDRYKKDHEKYQYYVKNYKNIRNFKKVYPYALKTRDLIENLNKQLMTMTNEGEKKQLIKDTEKMLFKEYEAAVRTMSTSQGRLLLKLIARETNKTGYDIIKDYKGGFSASFWYGVGKIFGTDLKSEFHKEKEDSLIENILSKYNENDLY